MEARKLITPESIICYSSGDDKASLECTALVSLTVLPLPLRCPNPYTPQIVTSRVLILDVPLCRTQSAV